MFIQFKIIGFEHSTRLPIIISRTPMSSLLFDSQLQHRVNRHAATWSAKFGRMLVLILTAILFSGCSLNGPHPEIGTNGSAETSSDYITNDQLEAQHGIRITLIAVTAGGGFIDFRYKVTDPQKATALLHNPANAAVLTVIGSGQSLSATKMSRHHNQMAMKRGAVPYTFYPNVKGVMKPGALVSIAFGSVKVEPLVAQ